MNVIILSGGSGKRLWPLSNDIRSKQFIKIFRSPTGEYESMLQRVYRQIREVSADSSITIATSKTQISSIHNQIGEDADISLEPDRRDTFAAIALVSAYLHDIKRAEYVAITDEEAVKAFEYLSRTEGIIPAIESAHAVAHAIKIAGENKNKNKIIVITISGRGDKDCASVARYRGENINDD